MKEFDFTQEKSACGVGFIASRKNEYSHENLQKSLHALRCVEHRGACSVDQISSDGAGIMTDIPFEMFGYEAGSVAVATLFAPHDSRRRRKALKVFEETFQFFGLKVLDYRNVPVNPVVLGESAKETMPYIMHCFIERPVHCRTDNSFEKLLHAAKQMTRTKERQSGISKEFFFCSLSTNTIVYKALTRSVDLDKFYLDLQNPKFKTRFALFHRRFSTNTKTSWDKVQPFRLIGHNGEINTITGNRSWALSRERYLGLTKDELLTHSEISDSGSLNEMAEALMYRSSIPHLEDILAIMIPPADQHNDFYKFWSRAMEPWDGPAFINYCDGTSIGARLDRNGFRPCRWVSTPSHFYLSSEAGSFEVNEEEIIKKGTLPAGSGVKMSFHTGDLHFRDPSQSRENHDANFDPRLIPLGDLNPDKDPHQLNKQHLFNYTKEEISNILIPMITEGKEPIGSMGDTARPAIFSDQPRTFFDYFYQNFAQVTNPPLDYLREKMVTDLSTYLGKRPNIFSPKELIPPVTAFEVDSPVLSLGQMKTITELADKKHRIKTAIFDMIFDRSHGEVGFRSAIRNITNEAIEQVRNGVSLIVITDRKAGYKNPPIPSLLMLRALVNALNDSGGRLDCSIVVDSAEVRNTHHVAALIGFGATAVCPYLALQLARYEENRKLKDLSADEKERNVITALEMGVLKIMAKSGISVVRSYQSSKLFSALGIGSELKRLFFPGLFSPIGGLEIAEIVENILINTDKGKEAEEAGKNLHTYQFKEHNRDKMGEKHSMTNSRSKIIHELVRETGKDLNDTELYNEYLKLGLDADPVSIRHLFDIKKPEAPIPLERTEAREDIMKRFGSGAMSFGAISAESQRDIFEAMREIGGRCNSGEGGENPYYFESGITGTIKQVASARFGVNAEYLVTGDEIQIKVAQGAKPGEGGQLMGLKVNADIAFARNSEPGFDLISPPPLHDIYSIEDLKQLIYELKQLKPGTKVNVKLVAGQNIGTIAVGVAKAGADVIHVSGGDGGTGAASLSSMKHAGLPWELGVIEVHTALVANKLREHIKLRTDGGLSTGKDIVLAAILGAEGYDFGKLLLVAQGCVMARICEKNTCPTGIATHDPKFKKKYKGEKEHVVTMMKYLADDVRRVLSKAGITSLREIIGRTDLLEISELHEELVDKRHINLDFFLGKSQPAQNMRPNPFSEGVNPLNHRILEDAKIAVKEENAIDLNYKITTHDRAVPATLAGHIAEGVHAKRAQHFGKKSALSDKFRFGGQLNLNFTGSAGQGFGVFMVEGLNINLKGEANDSVCKTMSGGRAVITPPEKANYKAEENAIIGNCALYGATGGVLYINGRAGDRFAVRNSGATAVVEGTGLHACEYMTNGTVVILGSVSHNVGAGMTGGTLYLRQDQIPFVNDEYLSPVEMDNTDRKFLNELLQDYYRETDSNTAKDVLLDWEKQHRTFVKLLPIGVLAKQEEEKRLAAEEKEEQKKEKS